MNVDGHHPVPCCRRRSYRKEHKESSCSAHGLEVDLCSALEILFNGALDESVLEPAPYAYINKCSEPEEPGSKITAFVCDHFIVMRGGRIINGRILPVIQVM